MALKLNLITLSYTTDGVNFQENSFVADDAASEQMSEISKIATQIKRAHPHLKGAITKINKLGELVFYMNSSAIHRVSITARFDSIFHLLDQRTQAPEEDPESVPLENPQTPTPFTDTHSDLPETPTHVLTDSRPALPPVPALKEIETLESLREDLRERLRSSVLIKSEYEGKLIELKRQRGYLLTPRDVKDQIVFYEAKLKEVEPTIKILEKAFTITDKEFLKLMLDVLDHEEKIKECEDRNILLYEQLRQTNDDVDELQIDEPLTSRAHEMVDYLERKEDYEVTVYLGNLQDRLMEALALNQLLCRQLSK